jgi:GTP cyclohydrolase IA
MSFIIKKYIAHPPFHFKGGGLYYLHKKDINMDALVKSPTKKGSKEEITKPTREEAENAVRVLLKFIGENPAREGLLDTPRRMVKSWEANFGGYGKSPDEDLETIFEEVGGYKDIILVRDIPFFSHCEHHVVPIIGKAHIGYYPNQGVTGLSKFARVVDIFSRRMQTQENLTAQIVEAIENKLKPRGLAVMIEAEHMCMSMRGVQKQGVSTVTTGFTGVFENSAEHQARFMMLLRGLK